MFFGGEEMCVFLGSDVQLMKQYGRQVTTCIPKRHTPPKKQTPPTRWAPTSYINGVLTYNPTISGVI